MKRFIAVLAVLLLGGCASAPGWYGEVGAGIMIDAYTDELINTKARGQCSVQPTAQIEVGYEFKNFPLMPYLHHQSWWFCGGPLHSDRAEMYYNEIGLKGRWGGRQ